MDERVGVGEEAYTGESECDVDFGTDAGCFGEGELLGWYCLVLLVVILAGVTRRDERRAHKVAYSSEVGSLCA